MKAPSRFLPSIASLRALEALDRLGSASAVAKELSQTQSAVSRQLQALEAQLGVNLILRKAKRMQMTPEARMYTALLAVCSAVVSVAHRRSVRRFHSSFLTIDEHGHCLYEPSRG